MKSRTKKKTEKRGSSSGKKTEKNGLSSGRGSTKKRSSRKSKRIEPEDLTDVLRSAETGQEKDSLPDVMKEVGEVVEKVHYEVGGRRNNSTSSADYTQENNLGQYHSEVDLEAPQLQESIEPEEAAAADDFTLYKLKKTTDPVDRLHGGDYDKPWGNFFMSYLRDSVTNRLKQANSLAKKSLKSAMHSAHSVYGSLYSLAHHKKK